MPRLDASLRDAERFEIFGLIDAPKEGVQGQPDKTEPAGAVRQIESELAAVQAGARTELKTRDLIFVIADKEERRPPGELLAFERDLQIEKREPPEGLDRGPEKGRPFPAREPLLLRLAARYDLRIDAETGVVDEDAAVYFAGVDRRNLAVFDRPDG
jgi:hypothetical protein